MRNASGHAAAGEPKSVGRIGHWGRRVSFFSPSPTANPVGVEEGHRVSALVPFLFVEGPSEETPAPDQYLCKGRCSMSGSVLLDIVKLEHANRVRKAERDRVYIEARRTCGRPSILRNLLTSLKRS